jgi:SNF2 family DNA or RNA helicase
MGGFEGKQIVGVQNEAELQERFFSRAFRVTADEALDLPGVLWTSHYCDLEPKARKIYDELEAAFYSAVEEGEITAANALVKLIRLHQIASGHIVFDEDDSPTEISRHKYEALIDILEGLDEPVVCFARFRADLRLVEEAAKYLDRRYGEVSGSRKDLNDEARFPKDLDILGVNIQSGGVGVDLTRARVAIYMSCGFSLGDFEQSAKRLDRPGQNHKVLYIRLITNHTIDETIYLALAARKNAVEAVLEAGNEARV